MAKEMMTSYFKIRVDNPDFLRRAKKLAFKGFGRADGSGLYRTMSIHTKEDMQRYLESLGMKVLSLSKMSATT